MNNEVYNSDMTEPSTHLHLMQAWLILGVLGSSTCLLDGGGSSLLH